MVHSSPEFGLIVAAVQSLKYETRIGTLATLEPGTNHPYASLVATAPDADGAPLFLISNLALHTRNLEADPRATVLLAAQTEGDPLNAGRVSLMGRAAPADDPGVRSRFLARHPEAAGYAGFADFRFWRLTPERAHYVGGFGRIVTLDAGEFVPDREASLAWAAAADEIVARLNTGTPLVAELLGEREAGWRIAACDPYGCELVAGKRTYRLAFEAKLTDPAGLENALREAARRKAAPGA